MPKPTAKQQVAEYYMSIHLGLCHGPVDAITGLFVGEKLAWEGEVTAEGDVYVNSPQLFGGPTSQGGVGGDMYYLPGGPTQVMPDDLASRLGKTAATCPAYRGIGSVFFKGTLNTSLGTVGSHGNKKRGFYWTANSPYIQGMWVRTRRAPVAPALSSTLSDAYIPLTLTSTVYIPGTVLGGVLGTPGYTTTVTKIQQNANPAFLIYECLTNTDWGMGGAPGEIDVASFNYAAQVYRNEAFGLFLQWDQQSTIEDFVGTVLDTVQTYLFLNPRTGLWTLTPLRNDYVVADLPLYNPDNCIISDYDRKTFDSTINEVVVTWTNPVTEQQETVTVQDLANIVQQGGQIVSQAKDYSGIRSKDVALFAATRDLRAGCAPLATCTLQAHRVAWALVPGQCLRLTWPEEDIVEKVMRVADVGYGNSSDGYVTVSLIEDIFALDSTVYTGGQDSLFENPAQPPNAIANVLVKTAPAYIVANTVFAQTPVDPEVVALVMAADPNPDFLSLEPVTDVVLANGTTVKASVGTDTPVGYATLGTALVAEASTVGLTLATPSGRPPGLADFVWCGTEVMLVQAISTSGVVTLARGVLDTIPVAHAAGTPMWFLSQDEDVVDRTLRAPGETVTYNLLMRTSLGLLDTASSPDVTFTLSSRPYLPLRPADVKVNGTGFGTVALSGGDAAVTWSTRNRLLETSIVLPWTAGSVVPENDQTTTIEVLDNSGTVVHSYTGLGGISFTVPAADAAGGVAIRVASVSASNGRSLQAFAIGYTP